MATPESIPPKLNWVEKRAACSVSQIFGELQNGFDEDIEAINKARNLPEDRRFLMTPLSGGTTVVIAQNNGYPMERIKVGFCENKILAEDQAAPNKWEATVRLNEAGRCVLWVENAPLEQWQFRKMILQRVFFGDV